MYIDSHTHLDFFKENISKAIYDINENRIITLANSMDLESYMINKEYGKKSKYIIPTFGIHPWKAAEYCGNLVDLIKYIEESPIIGEIGLDYVWVEDKSTYFRQREIFYYILKESINRNKWISLHTKGAEEEIYNALKEFKYNKVIIHWYSGPLEILDKLIELGCYFTISVDIGYSELTKEIINRVPLNRLLVETDGPTALEWVNGEYAYPSYIKEVIRKLSVYIGISESNLIKIIEENFFRILNNVK